MTATTDQLAIDVKRTALLEFRWDGSNVARFARHDEDVTIGGDTYARQPNLVVGEIRRSGSMQRETMDLENTVDSDPFNLLAGQINAPKVFCTVSVCDPGNAASTKREIFYGDIGIAEPTGGDDAGIYKYTLVGIKARLEARIGFVADNYCQNILGDEACGLDLAAITKTATVTDIGTDGRENRVTVSWSGGTPDLTDARWRSGGLIWNGAVYSILASAGSSKFDLELPLPASADGETVTMEPGCDGSLATCRSVYNNENNSTILGLDMQDRFPLTEVA